MRILPDCGLSGIPSKLLTHVGQMGFFGSKEQSSPIRNELRRRCTAPPTRIETRRSFSGPGTDKTPGTYEALRNRNLRCKESPRDLRDTEPANDFERQRNACRPCQDRMTTHEYQRKLFVGEFFCET
jgi:hypothetical protein